MSLYKSKRLYLNISNYFVRNMDFLSFRMFSDMNFREDLNLSKKISIEKKWSAKLNAGSFDPGKNDKFYILSMFPYPSGNLHMGHVRVYTISDALARFHRMNGRNVFHPMGFDAFGLPAENAARQHGVDPAAWTHTNISSMREQLTSLGLSFDWEREVITCSEEYYKFTQYLFLLLYQQGLIYQKEALVNWDPVDGTVLADEQVDSAGKSWRSGASVEKKLLKQWFIRTTAFAKDLYDGLDDPTLEDWRDIINLQKHWIGECNGFRFDFNVILNEEPIDNVSIWHRYPEHLPHAAYIVASSSSLLRMKYQNENIQILNPFNQKLLPLFISDNVPFDEGCDIKIGIPSFYEEDRDFALEKGILFKETDLVYDPELRRKLVELARLSGQGGQTVSSKLRDWLVSRQRLWGTPIPVVHCGSCGPQPFDFKDLPVRPTDPPQLKCPKCGVMGRRETDTLDTFVDSAWYYLRYTDPQNPVEPFSPEEANRLMPVDIYIGGKEHAVLHLYYARFLSHFLNSIGRLEVREPFRRLLVQGMVLGRTYYLETTGECLTKDRVTRQDGQLYDKETQMKVVEVWEKMSKSKYNGVEPSGILAEYGLDTARLLVLGEVAPQSHRNWDSSKFAGVLNWQKRLWSLMGDFIEARRETTSPPAAAGGESGRREPDLWDARNYYVKGASFNYGTSHQLSIVISKLQGLTNTLKKCDKSTMRSSRYFERCLGDLIIMLHPLVPHFSSELWEGFIGATAGGRRAGDDLGLWQAEEEYFVRDLPLHLQPWPQLDSDYQLQLICKVNNAVKAYVEIPFCKFTEMSKEDAIQVALSQKKVTSFIRNRQILDYDYKVVKNYEATINIEVERASSSKEKVEQKRSQEN